MANGPFMEQVEAARQGRLNAPTFTREEQVQRAPLEDFTVKAIFGNVASIADSAAKIKQEKDRDKIEEEFRSFKRAAELTTESFGLEGNALDQFLERRINPNDPRANEIREVFIGMRQARAQGKLSSLKLKTMAEARMKQLIRQNPGMEDFIIEAAKGTLGFDPTGSELNESLSLLRAQENAKEQQSPEDQFFAKPEGIGLLGAAGGDRNLALQMHAQSTTRRLANEVATASARFFNENPQGRAARESAKDLAVALTYSQMHKVFANARENGLDLTDLDNMSDQEIKGFLTQLNSLAIQEEALIDQALASQGTVNIPGVGETPVGAGISAEHRKLISQAMRDEIDNLRKLFNPKDFKEYLALTNDIKEESVRKLLLSNPIVAKAYALGGPQVARQVLSAMGAAKLTFENDVQWQSFLRGNSEIVGLMGSTSREEFLNLWGDLDFQVQQVVQGNSPTPPKKEDPPPKPESAAPSLTMGDTEKRTHLTGNAVVMNSPNISKEDFISRLDTNLAVHGIDPSLEALKNDQTKANYRRWPEAAARLQGAVMTDIDGMVDELASRVDDSFWSSLDPEVWFDGLEGGDTFEVYRDDGVPQIRVVGDVRGPVLPGLSRPGGPQDLLATPHLAATKGLLKAISRIDRGNPIAKINDRLRRMGENSEVFEMGLLEEQLKKSLSKMNETFKVPLRQQPDALLFNNPSPDEETRKEILRRGQEFRRRADSYDRFLQDLRKEPVGPGVVVQDTDTGEVSITGEDSRPQPLGPSEPVEPAEELDVKFKDSTVLLQSKNPEGEDVEVSPAVVSAMSVADSALRAAGLPEMVVSDIVTDFNNAALVKERHPRSKHHTGDAFDIGLNASGMTDEQAREAIKILRKELGPQGFVVVDKIKDDHIHIQLNRK